MILDSFENYNLFGFGKFCYYKRISYLCMASFLILFVFLQAKVWDLRTNNVMRSFSNHPGGIYSVCFTEDGQKLFTGSVEKVYDLTQIYIYKRKKCGSI